MLAMQMNRTVSLTEESEPLSAVNLPIPEPASDEILVKVSTCGVCHTELDEIEGRAPPPRLPVVPGHEVVGIIDAVGASVSPTRIGD